MGTIDRILLTDAPAPAASSRVASLWQAVTTQVTAWLAQRAVAPRDAIVLLPFAALLAPARTAFAAAGGWQPRVETVLTLAASLGPPLAPEPGQCSGDWTLDHLNASALLRRLPWGRSWQQRDAAGFERGVAALVDTAQALRSAALERPTADRAAFWAQADARIGSTAGPAATEGVLLRVALQWAQASVGGNADAADTDRLFHLRPGAWIVLQLGGPDAQAEALLGHVQTPSLHLLADPPADDPFAAAAADAAVDRLLCDDFEAEAQAAAAQVIDALNARRTPVALVVVDRELVRRVRALLERAQVALVDETGWLLSTTRAAAGVVALLRAAAPGAGRDSILDWLKTAPAAQARPAALAALESLWRGSRQAAAHAGADALWADAQTHLQPLARGGVHALGDWLALLHERLAADRSLDRLDSDAAGQQLQAALGWPASAPRQHAAAGLQLDLAGFTAWVQLTLERTPFLPPPDAGAEVVLTPLARAFGRPFGQVVLPGADHLRLGSIDAAPSLLGDAAAAALGLPHAAQRRQSRRLALAQLLRADAVTLLRRRRDGDEPLADSPDVEWLLLARARTGRAPWPLRGWQPPTRHVPRQPVAPPQPQAPAALPAVLSASKLEALRQCPYRFYARAVLRLNASDEIDAGLAKRDYGTWLHAVLHRFHSQRRLQADDPAQLHAAADAVTLELQMSAADLLPYRASFDSFAPAYLRWLHERDARGWCWHSGEAVHELDLPDPAGLRLHGRIDRLDHGPAGQAQLLDYKTGNAAGLKTKVTQPLEDTQLAFYAALVGAAQPTVPAQLQPRTGHRDIGAAYLALDDAKAPLEIPHPQVHETATVMLHQLAGEWRRLRAGAAMPALGEGRVCAFCDARGLCRRDHWSPPADAAAQGQAD